MNEVKRAFAGIDKNGDGLISKEEMYQCDTFNSQVGILNFYPKGQNYLPGSFRLNHSKGTNNSILIFLF